MNNLPREWHTSYEYLAFEKGVQRPTKHFVKPDNWYRNTPYTIVHEYARAGETRNEVSARLMQMVAHGVDSIQRTSRLSGRAFMPVGMQPIPRSNEDEEERTTTVQTKPAKFNSVVAGSPRHC